MHIGINLPDNAAMRVGNSTRHWAEGKALLFDDSFEHEVWNNGTEPRLVFIFDVWHPELRTDEQRRRTLDGKSLRRYEDATSNLRAGYDLPDSTSHDLLAERRKKVVY